MLRKIRDLDFDAIIAQVARATNPARRIACEGNIQAGLAFVVSRADAVTKLRNHVMHSVLDHTKCLDDVRFEQPLVQALVRVQHHPLAEPIPFVNVEEGLRGPDAAPRLREIVAAHPELTWDVDEVQALIVRAIRDEHGDHELDDAEPPWRMYWSPASGAAFTLFWLVTLRTLGDLS